MTTTVGYALVSQTHRVAWRPCSLCGPTWRDRCAPPKRPACHAACVPHAERLAEHPECQEWQRRYDAWYAAHHGEEPTGGTRLGPLHYFADCQTLLKRGPRRKDARIVSLESATAAALGLPVCKECAAKMAPFEEQLQEATTYRAQTPFPDAR